MSSATNKRVIAGNCGICPSGCSATITLQGDRITRVVPDPNRPDGIGCRRAARAPEILYSPDRLLHPLARDGARGENRFRRVGWDEALGTIAARMREIRSRFGPEALCLYAGHGTFERSLWEMLSPAGVRETCAWSLLFPFGSPNTAGAGSNCYVSHAVIAPAVTLGVWWIDTFADLERSNLVVVWGTNPANASPAQLMKEILKARRRGARVIVIDHRRTETAVRADAQWIAVRPGTDGALALAFLNVVLQERLYDAHFAAEWTVGLDELAIYASRFSPEYASGITGVSPEIIRQTARDIALAHGASLLSYSGLEYTNSGVQNIRAVMILWVLTGNIDVPGGNVIKTPDTDFRVSARHRLSPPALPAPVGADVYPAFHHFRKEAQAMELPRAILEGHPYPVRGLLVFGASIITGYPNPGLWRRSFSALDFLLVVDRYPTQDSRYADIILPAATSFETDSYLISGNSVRLRRKVVEPVGESRSDWDIVSALAQHLGYGHLFPGSTREMLQWALEGTGVDLPALEANPEGVHLPSRPNQFRKWESGMLRPDSAPGFPTPSGKVEIASSILRDFGYDALPVFVPPAEGPVGSPSLASRYPLVFNSGARSKPFFLSQHRNIPALVSQRPHPLVWIHPRDAEARGIRDGDPVDVVSPRGRVRFRAFVTEDIMQGCVEADANGGSPIAPEPWRQCNVNDLTDADNRDPISGFPVYKALLCDVIRAGS
ncbi:MAG TPA: molybdopterin-dependent oxidoreductase [Spirochaetia bacterium]|nr:molybdopterin-dependent oxidoreductase [Spirochaetia bacterium]